MTPTFRPLSVEQPPEALIADQARRAGAARAIGMVFSALHVGAILLYAQGKFLPIAMATNVAMMIIYAWCSAWARVPSRASQAGAGLVALLLLQMVLLSVTTVKPDEAVLLSLFTGLGPLVAAATLRAKGVVIAGIIGALIFAAQVLLHTSDVQGVQVFSSALIFYLATWAIATFSSLASNRALEAHAAQEESARLAHRAARNAEVRYELMAEHMRDLLALLDADGAYLFASPSFERVLGVEPQLLLGRTTPEFLHADDYSLTAASFERAKAEGTSSVVARLRVATGEYHWFHVLYSSILAEGKPVIAVSARDIHEEQLLSSALEEARRVEALGRLASGVAHDFNNLLMVIQSCAEFVEAELEPGHAAHRDLELLGVSVKRATALTGQLLTFARRQVLPSESCSVPAQTITSLEAIISRLIGPEIQLQLLVDDSDRQVEASSIQIEQILINLAVNARDAMPEGGTLRIAVRDRSLISGEIADLPGGHYIELKVEDTGAGIAPEVQSRIFEPFFTTKEAGKGTGLGLATVSGLVSQLGGHIGVHSVTGKGTTFTLLLPEFKPQLGLDTQVDEADRQASFRPDAKALQVLVVDDESSIRELICRILVGAGHSVVEAGSVESAVDLAEASRGQFDLVITDVVLGIGDGIGMLERIEAVQPQAGVVVISGFSPSPERIAEVTRRRAEYLAKPFGAEELVQAMERTLARTRAL